MKQPTHELRVALVLYGGVSLAIYENGVTRSFHDLVRRQGFFDLLLKLLDAEAAVDVIAGTSAGGINGLLLAAALENGTDFAATAKLWRQEGDLGTLMRDPAREKVPDSLLDGRYYHKRLVEALQELCHPIDPNYQSRSEMDLFMTGTDLDGVILRFWDDLGQELRDKSHRVVFHLKHRFCRRSLGFKGWKQKDAEHDEQAWILGTIARITGSFPVAFPPFNLKQIDGEDARYRDVVAKALSASTQRSRGAADYPDITESTSLVDGGVLDNAPFGPALRAIFYRMPSAVTERRLFYVEPDPNPYIGHTPDPDRHTPLMTAISTLSTIPSHESLHADMLRLREHNERAAWMDSLRRELLSQGAVPTAEQEQLYMKVRTEALARLLLLDTDAAASAADRIADPARLRLLNPFRTLLREIVETHPAELNRWDPDYHLRRAFRVLYVYRELLRGLPGADAPPIRCTARLLGRVIKALKLVRDTTVVLRNHLLEELDFMRPPAELAPEILALYQQFLSADASHWQVLRGELDLMHMASPSSLVDREARFLPSQRLSETAHVARQVQPSMLRESSEQVSGSILDSLDAAIRWIENDYTHAHLDEADRLDVMLYPVEFGSGLYELDQVQLVRVSPRDAQIGLSRGELKDKVTGEELGHFSAFLRRDWRASDILRGRIDGICQIVRAYMDADALVRMRARADSVDALLSEENLRKVFTAAEDWPQRLRASWEQVYEEWRGSPIPAEQVMSDNEKAFRNNLIEAAQTQAFMEEAGSVHEAMEFQERVWGRRRGSDGVGSESPDASVELSVSKASKTFLKGWPFADLWHWFKGIAKQKALGRDGVVPRHVLGEYVSRAYLLIYGMMERSLGERGGFLRKPKVKWVFRTPVAVLNLVTRLITEDARAAAQLITGIVTTLIAVAAVSFYHGHSRWGWAAAVVVLTFMVLISWLSPRKKKGAILAVLTAAVLSAALGLGLVWFGAEAWAWLKLLWASWQA